MIGEKYPDAADRVDEPAAVFTPCPVRSRPGSRPLTSQALRPSALQSTTPLSVFTNSGAARPQSVTFVRASNQQQLWPRTKTFVGYGPDSTQQVRMTDRSLVDSRLLGYTVAYMMIQRSARASASPAAARSITSVSILIYKRCGCAAGGHVRLSQSRPTCQSSVAVLIIIARPTDLRWVIGLSFGVHKESKLLQNCLWLVENMLTQQSRSTCWVSVTPESPGDEGRGDLNLVSDFTN